jgi:hypothetical protein
MNMLGLDLELINCSELYEIRKLNKKFRYAI